MKLVYGEESREVVLRETKEGVEVMVDGTGHAFRLEQTGPGSFVLRQETRVLTFHCVRDGEEIHLFWEGAVYRLTEEKEGARRLHRAAAGGLEAPMPGKVIKVNATPGQKVAKGDEILIIEAMKMENAVRAPREGRVKSVAVGVGDMVNPGVVLVELE